MAQALSTIEQILQRHGDDMYRLALLLAPNANSAATAMTRAVGRLAAAPPDKPDEDALIHALVTALPPERPRRMRRGLPEWVMAAPDAHAATCVALARLPRQQRLVLGLAALQHWDAERIAQFTGGDVVVAQTLTREALLALAPQAVPDLDTEAMRGGDAPDACRATRAALGLNHAALRHDPAVRGHLALCSACRAVEHDWQQLADAVVDALRGALREEHMPAALSAQLHDMLAAQAQPPSHSPRPFCNWRRALLPLGIIALIAVLVLPKARPPTLEANTAASSLAPLDLVQRAAANLYQPPENERAQHPYDVWHGQWQMRWDFSDNSYAMLNGDLWRDMASSRHRVQLVHEQGGGPFEFELADGENRVYYATTENYGKSLYPLVFDTNKARLALQVPAEEQARLLDARLSAGAWGLAQAYLQRATAASDLRSWGQQRAADGSMVEVLGFRGMSPLGLPAGAPGADANPPTILLTMNLEDGTLREVRELAGPPGGEQVGRTIWRFMGGEWISASPQISATFSLEQAWNGIGKFVTTSRTVVSAALPIITSDIVRPLANALTEQWQWAWLPPTPPPGTTSAMLLNNNVNPPSGAMMAGGAVYTGAGRYLALQSGWTDVANLPLRGGNVEYSNQADRAIQFQPGIHQQYEAVIFPKNQPNQSGMFIRLSARGYTRDELLQIISTLGPLDTQGLQAQARLYADPRRSDPAAFDALLGALGPGDPLPYGMTRYIAARVFQRRNPQAERLTDPYHRPLNGGRPPDLLVDTWMRAGADGKITEVAERTQNADGTLYDATYTGPSVTWAYDAPTSYAQKSSSQANVSPLLTFSYGQTTALRMLACGAARIETLADGSRAVVVSEMSGQSGQYQYCTLPNYVDLISNQTYEEANWFGPSAARGPYLLDLVMDLASKPLTTWLYLTPEGQPGRVEVRLGTDRSGMLLESWELITDEQTTSGQAPQDVFSTQPPQALIMDDYSMPVSEAEVSTIRTVTLTEAVQLAQTPFWQIPTDDQVKLMQIETGTQGSMFRNSDDLFENAIERGMAVRSRYELQTPDGMRVLYLYQGAAQQFGGFLRAQARWENSRPVQLRAAGRDVSGWEVTALSGLYGLNWTLFELDGTLIAVNRPATEIDQNLLDRLQPIKP